MVLNRHQKRELRIGSEKLPKLPKLAVSLSKLPVLAVIPVFLAQLDPLTSEAI